MHDYENQCNNFIEQTKLHRNRISRQSSWQQKVSKATGMITFGAKIQTIFITAEIFTKLFIQFKSFCKIKYTYIVNTPFNIR